MGRLEEIQAPDLQRLREFAGRFDEGFTVGLASRAELQMLCDALPWLLARLTETEEALRQERLRVAACAAPCKCVERQETDTLAREIIGEAYNLITQGESPTQRRQPSARRIYDLAYKLLGEPNPLAAVESGCERGCRSYHAGCDYPDCMA